MDLFANNFHGLGFGGFPFGVSPFGGSNSFFNDAFLDFHPNAFARPSFNFGAPHAQFYNRPYGRRSRHRYPSQYHHGSFFNNFDTPSLFESGSDYLDRVYDAMNARNYDHYRRKLERSNHGFKKYSRSLSEKENSNSNFNTQSQNSCSNGASQAQTQTQTQPQVEAQAQVEAPSQRQRLSNFPFSDFRDRYLSDYFSAFDDFFSFPSDSFFDNFFDSIPHPYRYINPSQQQQQLTDPTASGDSTGTELVAPSSSSATDAAYQLETLPESHLNSWASLPDNPKLSQDLASRYSDSSSGSYFQASYNNKDGWKYIKASWPHVPKTGSGSASGSAAPSDSGASPSGSAAGASTSASASETPSPSLTPQPIVGSNGELRMMDPEDTSNEYIML